MLQDPRQGEEGPHKYRAVESRFLPLAQLLKYQHKKQDKYPGENLGGLIADPEIQGDIKQKSSIKCRIEKNARARYRITTLGYFPG